MMLARHLKHECRKPWLVTLELKRSGGTFLVMYQQHHSAPTPPQQLLHNMQPPLQPVGIQLHCQPTNMQPQPQQPSQPSNLQQLQPQAIQNGLGLTIAIPPSQGNTLGQLHNGQLMVQSPEPLSVQLVSHPFKRN